MSTTTSKKRRKRNPDVVHTARSVRRTKKRAKQDDEETLQLLPKLDGEEPKEPLAVVRRETYMAPFVGRDPRAALCTKIAHDLSSKCGRRVHSIEFVDNPALIRAYRDEGRRLDKLDQVRWAGPSATSGKELVVYHGTSRYATNRIVETGFDLHLAGSKHGQAHGFGIYVTENPQLAVGYTHNHEPLLVCRLWRNAVTRTHVKGATPIYIVPNPNGLLPHCIVHFQ